MEHYRQINQYLRDSDRKRDVFLGGYLVLITGGLSFAFSLNNQLPFILSIQAGLFTLGILVGIFTGIARAWHCEYNRVAMAIHKCFLEGTFDLLQAAKRLKDSEKMGHYFNPRGTEFVIMMFVLLLLSFQAALLVIAQGYPHVSSLWLKVVLIIAAVILPVLIGIWWYKIYLRKRESEFPQQCWSILQIEKQKGQMPKPQNG